MHVHTHTRTHVAAEKQKFVSGVVVSHGTSRISFWALGVKGRILQVLRDTCLVPYGILWKSSHIVTCHLEWSAHEVASVFAAIEVYEGHIKGRVKNQCTIMVCQWFFLLSSHKIVVLLIIDHVIMLFWQKRGDCWGGDTSIFEELGDGE